METRSNIPAACPTSSAPLPTKPSVDVAMSPSPALFVGPFEF
jgi:hypothetical protein